MKLGQWVSGSVITILSTLFFSCRFLPSLSTDSDLTDLLFERVTIDDSYHDDPNFHGDAKGIADIDGDGFPDIVFGGNELVWYAYPHWTKTIIAKAEQEFTTDMQLADIDGDGDPDIIVPDGEKGMLCWFENPRPGGDPAKDPWRRHVVGYQGSWAHDVEVGDIDGDGKLDVLTRQAATIIWFQNTPESFTKVVISSASKGEGNALVDLNQDGRLDIIQNGYWLGCPNNPMDTAWTKHIIDEGAPHQLRVAVADINQDGRLDVLFVPAESGGELAWYEAPTDPKNGGWSKHVIDNDVEFVHSLQVGDVNNDGQLDIITAEMHQSRKRRVSIYFKDGYSLQWRKQIIATTGSHNMRIGDIGGDGDIDIIGANWGGDYHPLELWENKLIDRTTLPMEKGWTYIQVDHARAKWGDFAPPIYLRYFGLAMGDVTGDGYKDIVSGRYFYRNPGEAMTSRWPRTDFGMNVDGMLLVDVDGDGQLDVITQALPNAYWLKPLDVLGGSWNTTLIGTIPPTEHVNGQGYILAQIVPDGKPEIVFSGGDGIYYFEIPDEPSKGNWPRTKIADETSEEGIGIGDIDGDGDIDIVAASKDGRTIYWWENPGERSGEWRKHMVGSTVEWADRLAVADINGDRRLDVVVSEETRYKGASVYWFEQPEDPKSSEWLRHTMVTQYTTNSLDVADIDNDGDSDIITGEHRGTRKIAIWENMNNGASWVEHVIDTGKESHLGARVADLDGDGVLEIISIAWDTYPYLHVWRKNPEVSR